MALEKASRLNALATMVAARHCGLRLDEVVERFGVSLRTAQRMMRVLEQNFPATRTENDHEGRKVWRLPGSELGALTNVSAEELAALDLAREAFADSGHAGEAVLLRSLSEKMLALVPPKETVRIEPDRDALLEAQGLLARPGPRPRIDARTVDLIAEAIKSCRMLAIEYQPLGKPSRRHRVAPLGILLGLRRYLIAWKKGKPADWTSVLRVDSIRSIRLDDETFERPREYDLKEYAKRSFGAFQSGREYGDVVWRFSPDAASHAQCFEFHPDQEMTLGEDGALTVRFRAAGHLEMCWFLYAWGDRVEVIEPAALRDSIAEHRRGDFPAMP